MFQQISEPDIVLKILKEWNIDPEVRIDKAAYKKRKYRVQYAESDFAFISRMLEDSGIAWTHLQPVYNMQNFLKFAPSIQSQGTFYAPMKDGALSKSA